MNLSGRVCLLTGARRVGAVVAEALAQAGADVALVYHSSESASEETAKAVRDLGRRAVTIQGDLSDPEACAHVVAETVDALGRLDVLVAMASLYQPSPLATMTVADWDAQLNVDLRSAALCAQAAAPAMQARGGGRIILFSDWTAASGRPRYPGYVPYYVAKAGIKALAEALALELAPDGILVNAIAPGPILPPPDLSPGDRAAVEDATPVGRWGGEAEIAKAVLFLVESDFVTGETLRVDGGRHTK